MSVRSRGHGRHFIPQAQVQRKSRENVDIVLEESAKDRLSHPSPRYYARCVADEGQQVGGITESVVGEKVLKRTEFEVSTRLGRRCLVVDDPLHVPAEFQAVLAFGQKYVIVDLPRIPVVLVRGLSTQSSGKKRQPRYADEPDRISRHISHTGVRRERLDGLAAGGGGGIFAVIPQTERIHQG